MRETFVGRLLRLYSRLLSKHKYPTQIITGGLLWCSGDLLCQSLVRLSSSSTNETSTALGHHHQTDQSFPTWDWHRTFRMTLYGVLFSAPAYAFWYSALERHAQRVFAKPPGVASSTTLSTSSSSQIPPLLLINRLSSWFRALLLGGGSSGGGLVEARLRTWKIIGYKLTMDTFVFDPLYLSLFFAVTGALEGHSPSQIGNKLCDELLRTWLVDISVWTPIQTINFRYVPVLYQALVVQSCNIGWNAYLSFVQHHHKVKK